MNKLKNVTSFSVFPEDLNYNNTLFGGKVLSAIDLAGVAVCRKALYGTEADGCVTASMDKVDFKKPGYKGDIINLTAEIKSLGKSSIHVRVIVERESLKGELEEICTANVVFVAMKDGRPYKHGLTFEKLSENG